MLGQRLDPYRWFPFGGGIRRCIGMAFALYEMRVVLAELFHTRRLRLERGYRARAIRRSITLAPSGGVPVEVE
jgi:cytochrome P450